MMIPPVLLMRDVLMVRPVALIIVDVVIAPPDMGAPAPTVIADEYHTLRGQADNNHLPVRVIPITAQIERGAHEAQRDIGDIIDNYYRLLQRIDAVADPGGSTIRYQVYRPSTHGYADRLSSVIIIDGGSDIRNQNQEIIVWV